MRYQGPWNASGHRQRHPLRAQPKMSTKRIGDEVNNRKYFADPDAGWLFAHDPGGVVRKLDAYEDQVCGDCGVMCCVCRMLCEEHAPYYYPPSKLKEMVCNDCEAEKLETEKRAREQAIDDLGPEAERRLARNAPWSPLDRLQPITLRTNPGGLSDEAIIDRCKQVALLLDMRFERRGPPFEYLQLEARMRDGTEEVTWITALPMDTARMHGEQGIDPWLKETAHAVRRSRDETAARTAVANGVCPSCFATFASAAACNLCLKHKVVR